jgi:hypothetical protein
MPKGSRKPADFNRTRFAIIREETYPDDDPDEGKNPAAVELGRLRGGKARAAMLTPE